MSNRFVSGGTMGPGGEARRASAENDAETKQAQRTSPPLAAAAKTRPEWEAVQLELEAERKRRDEARLKAAAGGEQSLYDILQANKAAKQAAFEEKHRLKNQFRALDGDEAGFLDEVRERARADEERVRRETEEGLRAFRQRQRGGGEGEVAREGDEGWGVGRKRKRSARERDVRGLRRRTGGEELAGAPGPAPEGRDAAAGQGAAREPGPVEGGGRAGEGGRGVSALVDYGSDESD